MTLRGLAIWVIVRSGSDQLLDNNSFESTLPTILNIFLQIVITSFVGVFQSRQKIFTVFPKHERSWIAWSFCIFYIFVLLYLTNKIVKIMGKNIYQF